MALSRTSLVILVFAALGGFAGNYLEGYAAHGLEDVAGAYAVDIYHMSSKYLMWHILALLFLGLIYDRIGSRRSRIVLIVSAVAFAMALILFCGGMYLVPFGGRLEPVIAGAVFFQGAWLILAAGLAYAAFSNRPLKHREST